MYKKEGTASIYFITAKHSLVHMKTYALCYVACLNMSCFEAKEHQSNVDLTSKYSSFFYSSKQYSLVLN
jgi:hypothetical protein